MPGAVRNYIGLEGFIWFVGVVEDRNDPEQMNRVRVRCFGWHTDDKEMVPTDSLKWAHPVQATNNPAAYQPKEGDMVFGFFLDGEFGQNPVIVGTLPGKPLTKPSYDKGFSDPNKVYPKNINEPTVSRLSRNNKLKTVIETREKNRKKGIVSSGGVRWDEPSPYYRPKYGYNYAHESESGHAFEIDDTKGAERVHLSHYKGSGFEIGPDGSRIEKVVRDNYSLVMGDDFVYVGGKCSVTIDGNCNLKIKGKFNVEASEINMVSASSVKIKGGAGVQIEAGAAMDLKAGAAMNIGSGGKASLSGSTAVVAGSTVDLTGGQVNVQGTASPGIPKATGLQLSGGGSGFIGGAIGNSPLASLTAAARLQTFTAMNVANQTINSLGKIVGGITQSVSTAFSDITTKINAGLADLNSNMAIGQLAANMEQLTTDINNAAGDILALPTQQFNAVTQSIDTVVTKAADKGITMEIDPRLKAPEPEILTKLGKQLFPQTETVEYTLGANT